MDLYMELLSGTTVGPFLKMVRAMGAEDGHPLEAGGEEAVRALATGDQFARAWLIRAETQGPVIGYVVLTFGFSIEYGGRDCFIDELYVVPDARGRGIGAAALEFATEEARKRGIKALHLEVMRGNDRALDLYRKHGFSEVGRHLMNKWL